MIGGRVDASTGGIVIGLVDTIAVGTIGPGMVGGMVDGSSGGSRGGSSVISGLFEITLFGGAPTGIVAGSESSVNPDSGRVVSGVFVTGCNTAGISSV